MDANPRTKRIKDLQEQIHAWEFGLEDGERPGGRMGGGVGVKDAGG